MMQYYEFRIMRKPEDEGISFDEIAKRAYETLILFNKLPRCYRPKKQIGKGPSNRQLVDFTYESFYNSLKKGVNEEDGHVFQDLGYSDYYYSSLKNLQACGYDISVGLTNKMFVNSFNVEFAINIDYFNPQMSKLISELFEEAVTTFGAFWGICYDSLLHDKDDLTMDRSTPLAVHWLNYWSPEMIKNVGGEKKIQKLLKKYPKMSYHDGFLKLQDIALNSENPEDVKYKNDIDRELLG